MPVRHEEQVALADRVPVPAGIAEFVLCYNIIGKRLAERTLCWLFHDCSCELCTGISFQDSGILIIPQCCFRFPHQDNSAQDGEIILQ